MRLTYTEFKSICSTLVLQLLTSWIMISVTDQHASSDKFSISCSDILIGVSNGWSVADEKSWDLSLHFVHKITSYFPFLGFQVLYQWNNKNLITVRDLITEMVAWQRGRYLDPGIWEHFQSRINPAVLPNVISTLQLAPPTGQIPGLRYTVNIFLKFNMNLYLKN